MLFLLCDGNKRYIVLYCIALYCIALHYIALHCIALHCIALHSIALHSIALHGIALLCNALHCIVFLAEQREGGVAATENASQVEEKSAAASQAGQSTRPKQTDRRRRGAGRACQHLMTCHVVTASMFGDKSPFFLMEGRYQILCHCFLCDKRAMCPMW